VPGDPSDVRGSLMAAPPSAVTSAARIGPSPARYHLVRLFLRAIAGAYVHIRYEGVDHLPDEPYVICFNHPSWLDPIVLAASWPDRRRRLFIFGPRERDMSVGWRNHLITWTGRGVHFKPAGADVLDATRRATAVLRAGGLLAVAGEGRLSDLETEALPIETGVAHFAMLSGATILPTAIIGTRWVRFGGTIRLRVGTPIRVTHLPPGRAAAREVTEAIQSQLGELLAGAEESEPPGPFGRWLSEAFNDRPWLIGPGEDSETPPTLEHGPRGRRS
jgi:1-acyl-sn-glycerol-3-phosphate acyltransferase